MPKKSGYNTNLASEFHILSLLYRLDMDASLTLGNKKSVDIVVTRDKGDSITIDVKAVAGTVDWLVGSPGTTPKERHFVVLVSYEGKFADLGSIPRVWVLPHDEFLALVKVAKAPSTMHYISRKQVQALKNRESAWELLR